MNELEYLLTKCGLEWNYPNCPGNGDCSTSDNKKRIEYNLDKYKIKYWCYQEELINCLK